MISVHRIQQPLSDEPPFLLCRRGEYVAEVTAFLRRLLLQGSSITTLRAYAYDLLCFYRFIDVARISIATLTPTHALNFIAALKKSHAAPRTINRRIATIKQFLNTRKPGSGDAIFASSSAAFYKGRRNTALLGPTRIKQTRPGTLRVKVPSTITFPLEAKTVHAFLAMLRTYRDRAIVALLLSLGLRSCEIVDLQTHDINLDDAQVRIWGKGGKERLLPISPWIKSSIASYLAFERPDVKHTTCFVVLKGKHRGQALSLAGLRKIFRLRRSKDAALKAAHPHRFRHTFCTNLIRQRVPLPIVQKLMGHAAIDTTLLYINLSMEDVAAEYHRAMTELARIDHA